MEFLSPEMKSLREIDNTMAELRERNQARADAMKAEMGRKWVLHPDNAPKKMSNDRVLK